MIARLAAPIFAAGFAGALLIAPTPSFAAGAFEGLAGYWAGSGQVQMSDGSAERIRCQASYAVGGGGRLMQQKLTCASDSHKFDISSNVEESGGRLSGTWSESTRNVTGNVSGTVRGGGISAQVAGPGFNASLSVSTRGASQSVTIVPQGSDVRQISVSMKRR
ncbi:MAG: hypothetical protein QM576_19305 [Rhodopseudomonas sp.]|uniref:hypothetical protein n=1 Tax=unclassified Rhodopseudomonas TaxID=2638247 RepID=UPI0013DF252E|nr:hypothetical protein [Rhodopseudomonas sp. BR0M22]MCD0420464.1 hypothetical protein [Rubrivivax sp. JA1024]NEW93474.1 hypothetical protein [Rhodopseudomonas sp. BR0M22]